MSLKDYLKDKYKELILIIISIIIIFILLILFNSHELLIIFIMTILILNLIIIYINDFIKRKLFYNSTKKILKSLDQKYLITEIVEDTNFIDGKIMLEYLYEIDKSMHEYVNKYKSNSKEFIEYIELWCHEIKTPISTIKLIIENNHNEITNSIEEEINKIETYIEQVLYFSRSGNVEKDYIIKNTNLKEVINKVIKKNRKTLISKKIKVEINELYNTNTDAKWIEFIINQIISNSIKYSKDKESFIKIYSKNNKNNVILYIEDNGIGINSSEIGRVFDKGFTGSNGRKKYNSTGIGLYLCKKLCNKLGHNIEISSKENSKTIVTIIFPKSSMIKDAM